MIGLGEVRGVEEQGGKEDREKRGWGVGGRGKVRLGQVRETRVRRVRLGGADRGGD